MRKPKKCWYKAISDTTNPNDAGPTDASPLNASPVKARLKWLCRRGTKELDTAMNAYLLHHYDAADSTEQQLFSDLLHEQDPDIMVLINEPDTDSRYGILIRKIRQTLIAGA